MKSLAIILCTLLVVVAGCSKQQVDQAQDAIASTAPKLANDGLIYAQVESKLVSIDGNSALHVAVSSHDGEVRMSGRVKSDEIKSKFVAAAQGVSGVKNVADSLNVDTRLPSAGNQARDFALATSVRANVTAQAGVNGIALGINARGGVVTLDGKVATEAVHRTIVETAKTTSGVTTVVDHLHVDS